ncbi:MAG: undecaprenyl-diphosphate phosphatase [Verrucomicrobia bacterium]|nr:undecaprenyl-diphosphate phosphatase [Verrucomicrobiota bacterium]
MRGLCLLLLALYFPGFTSAASPPAPQEISPAEAQAQFTPTRVIVTGIVEGVTEFLPVSSTGHMIISDRLLGVDNDEHKIVRGVVDRKGRPVHLDRVADDYIVIIQFGAILAVLVVFFARLRQLLLGLLRLEPAALALTQSIAIAFLPAAVLGYLCKEYIPFSIEIVALALIAGGLVILLAEHYLPKHAAEPDEVLRLSWKQSLTIGLCQCVALIPGTSRSLATILGGRWAGLSAAAATEFSFLVGLAILSAASLYKVYGLGPALTQVYPVGSAGVGLVIAAGAAFLSVKWMVGFIMRRGMGPFAWYRIALGGVILVWRGLA